MDHRALGRALGLQALVALDAARRLVFGLALFPRQLDAAHAAFLGVDVGHVVDKAAEDAGARRAVGSDAKRQNADELLVVRRRLRRQGRRQGDDAEHGVGENSQTRGLVACRHGCLLWWNGSWVFRGVELNTGMARFSASPWRSARGARGRAARRSGRR